MMHYYIKMLLDNQHYATWVSTDLGSVHAMIMATEGLHAMQLSCSGFNDQMLIEHANRYLAFGGI